VWDTHSCANECSGSGVTVGSHRIVLVHPKTGAAEKIAEGTGIGAVRFDPSGTMFVQRDRKVFEGTAPLPPGVLLVPPVVPEAQVHCCGF
jgi:hypothetical protein